MGKIRELLHCSGCGNIIPDKDYHSRDDLAGVPVCNCKINRWAHKYSDVKQKGE
jgi:hypothetical protein